MGNRRPQPRFLRLETFEAREVPASGLLKIDPSQFATDRVIVKLAANATPRSPVIRSSENLGGGLHLLTLRSIVSLEGGLRSLQSLHGLQFAEPDYTIRVDAVPNDPSFSSLYGLNNTGQTGGTLDADMDAPAAWDVNTGSGNTIVAVIDTGVDYNHPDLAANMWHNPGEAADGIDNDGNGIIDDIYGADFANNDGNPMDDNGHGTHVSGTIGAVGNNGIGVAGVNWDVQIMALKFMTAGGSGSLSNAIKCLNYAVAKGAHISNNSWGGGGFSSSMNTAINNARNAGHIFVAAAGNGGSDGIGDNNDVVASYPSSYTQDNVLAVAATGNTDALASFSNYGPTTVDLAAPGVSILSTYPGGGYATMSGTSMATPQVAGAAALVWAAHPSWTYLEVIAALKATVDAKPSLTGKVATGGRLNLDGAIRYGGTPADTFGPKVNSANFSGAPGTIHSVRLTFSESISASSFLAADVSLSGPSGSVSITGVSPISATQFDVTFASQSSPGTYTLVVGPNITDSAGNAMNQNGVAPNGQVPHDQFSTNHTLSRSQSFNSIDVNKNIVDLSRTISVLTINQASTIADLNISMNLSHTYDSDLKITLVAPDGTQAVLVNRRGGSSNHFTNTVFNDEATVSIVQGAAPFSGSYRPEASLSAFDGKNAQGTWQLWVDDVARYDVGKINAWSISLNS